MNDDKYQVDGMVITPVKSQRPVDLANFDSADELVDFMQAMCNDVSEEDEAILRALYKKIKGVAK